MTNFIHKFLPRSALVLGALVLPFSAVADTEVPYTTISANTPEKIAIIEAVVIDRSGLAVAPYDLRPTGGLIEDAEVELAISSRPTARIHTVSDVTVVTRYATPPRRVQPAAPTTRSTRSGFEALGRSTPRREIARVAPRQAPVANRGQTAPAPTYLLGVFR